MSKTSAFIRPCNCDTYPYRRSGLRDPIQVFSFLLCTVTGTRKRRKSTGQRASEKRRTTRRRRADVRKSSALFSFTRLREASMYVEKPLVRVSCFDTPPLLCFFSRRLSLFPPSFFLQRLLFLGLLLFGVSPYTCMGKHGHMDGDRRSPRSLSLDLNVQLDRATRACAKKKMHR